MSLTSQDHVAFADAFERGDVEGVQAMLQQFPELASHPDWTPPPIHCAILWGQPRIVEVLLDAGVDIETLDPDRQTTPLRYAIMYCKTDSVQLLLSRGAETGTIVEGGTTALQLANEAAGGAYEEFDDLPRPEAYLDIVAVLKESGLTE